MEKQEKLELFKLLEQIKLGMLDETSARDLVRDPVGGHIRYEEQSVKRILELTGRHPYLIQYLCSELLSAGKVVRSRLVRPRDVEDCADMIVQDPTNDPKFDVLYEDFQTMDRGLPWKALLVLAECVGEQSRLPIPFEKVEEMWKGHFGTPAALGRALAALAMSQIVGEERMGRQSRYLIKSHLLQLWLRARRYIDRVH